MAPVRVLQVVPAMNAGGMENFIMNVYRAIDRQRVQFDFLYHFDMPCFFDEEITALAVVGTAMTLAGLVISEFVGIRKIPKKQ